MSRQDSGRWVTVGSLRIHARGRHGCAQATVLAGSPRPDRRSATVTVKDPVAVGSRILHGPDAAVTTRLRRRGPSHVVVKDLVALGSRILHGPDAAVTRRL